jgi:hypothetical protein
MHHGLNITNGPSGLAEKEVQMLKNERGYFLDNSELLQKLGCGSRLPKEGFNPVEVDGVMFKCEPSTGGRARPHRLQYFCKVCIEWIPCGRAGQHNRGRDHKYNHAQMVEAEGIPVTQRRGS